MEKAKSGKGENRNVLYCNSFPCMLRRVMAVHGSPANSGSPLRRCGVLAVSQCPAWGSWHGDADCHRSGCSVVVELYGYADAGKLPLDWHFFSSARQWGTNSVSDSIIHTLYSIESYFPRYSLICYEFSFSLTLCLQISGLGCSLSL